MTGTVTAGLDGSPQSIAAASWAAREAELRRDRLHLVHADDWPTTAVVRLVSPDEQRRWADTLLSRTSDELRKRHPGLEITTSRLSGRPAGLPVRRGFEGGNAGDRFAPLDGSAGLPHRFRHHGNDQCHRTARSTRQGRHFDGQGGDRSGYRRRTGRGHGLRTGKW